MSDGLGAGEIGACWLVIWVGAEVSTMVQRTAGTRVCCGLAIYCIVPKLLAFETSLGCRCDLAHGDMFSFDDQPIVDSLVCVFLCGEANYDMSILLGS